MEQNRLPESFYTSVDTLTLARQLLGCELVHHSPAGITSGTIVETEAYLANDPACHAFNRRTARTEPMYGDAGTIYIYLIYGMYQCINVVSNKNGIGEAVLIRALQPTEGTDLMRSRRAQARKNLSLKTIPDRELCRGPGKLVIAMGIDRGIYNGEKFTDGPLGIFKGTNSDFEIEVSQRIGINIGTELPYRFSIRSNSFVSK
jgi:DNA-3-methyladenine glycosylase